MFLLKIFFEDTKTEQLSRTGKIRPVGLGNPRDAAIGGQFRLNGSGAQKISAPR
jgi:hypothetical protein